MEWNTVETQKCLRCQRSIAEWNFLLSVLRKMMSMSFDFYIEAKVCTIRYELVASVIQKDNTDLI
jgi:hypothetical protein